MTIKSFRVVVYLPGGLFGKSGRGGAFRSLQRGFAHWSSGRLAKLEVNNLHPHFSHIRCQMTPSMRKGLYRVYILLGM